jgi:polyisoprenoid-binding protein YceI
MATATTLKTLVIDKAHSEVTFQVRHLITKVRGHFTDFEGTIEFDEAQPERSSVQVSIKAASIDTGVADRDTHLRSNDFFGVDTYPAITFRSTRIAKTGGSTFDVTGDLTIRDVTRAITLPVTHLGGANDPWGKQRAGFETEITINRKDYGLMWNATLETGGFLVGDEIKIALSIQAVVNEK